jgi:hypothetical protein
LKYLKYTFLTLLFINIFLFILPKVCYASFYATSAQIKIVTPITFQEIKQLNFGVIEPSATDKYVEVTPKGGIGSGTTATFVDSGVMSSAKVKVMGSDVNNISITASYLYNELAFEIQEMKAEYDGSQSGELISGMRNLTASSAGKELDFGAKIKINANTPEGNYTPGLRLSVNYE